jgi:hypothetical protein
MRLTTSTFDIMKADPTLGRAEALRRAMLAFLDDSSDSRNCIFGALGAVVLGANNRAAGPQSA